MTAPATDLRDTLERRRGPLREASIVAEVGATPDDVRASLRALGSLHQNAWDEQAEQDLLNRRFPACVVVALPGIGALDYVHGNYWTTVWQRVSVIPRQGDQTSWGHAFVMTTILISMHGPRGVSLRDSHVTSINLTEGTAVSSGNEPTLTASELRLLTAVQRGEPVNFLQAATEAEREVRPTVIRAVLMRNDIDPKGVDLAGATITGEVDLSHLNIVVPFRLTRCSISGGILLEETTLKAIHLDHVTSDLIYMWGAEVKGDARFTHCTLHGPVILANARIGGDLDFEGTQIESNSFAIMAQRANIGGHVYLMSDFVASGQGELGSVNFHGARISGMLQMPGARIDNPTGPAINAEGLNTEAVHARRGFRATGAGPLGAAVFKWANLRRLDLTGANVSNSSGPAVNADNLQAEHVYMRDGFVATGATEQGALLLRNARIQGQVSMRAAIIRNHDGVGLDAEGTEIGGSALLHLGFTVSASSPDFAVRLLAAKVAGELVFNGADITNDCGPGVLLDAIQVGRHVDLSASTSAEQGPGISLIGASIGSRLICAGGAVTVPLPAFLALDLRYSTIGGQLLLSNHYVRTRNSFTGGLLELDGLIYRGVPLQITLSEYLNILAHRTPRPATQPYRQLASGYQALGQDALVRRIGVQQQKDALRRDDAGRVRDFWGSFRLLPKRSVGWFIGFGWHPFRALWWIVATFVAVGVLAVAVLAPAQIVTPPTGSRFAPMSRTLCTPVDAVRLSAEIAIPVIKIGGRDRCDLNRDDKAYGFALAVSAILQTFGWAMFTLFVAGFTGVIRKL